MKQKKDRKMEKLKMIGKHNFQMDNFLDSEDESDQKLYESMLDREQMKSYSSFAQDKFMQQSSMKNQTNRSEPADSYLAGTPKVVQVSFSDQKIASSMRNTSMFRDFRCSYISKLQ